jgi:hypothetical protein
MPRKECSRPHMKRVTPRAVLCRRRFAFRTHAQCQRSQLPCVRIFQRHVNFRQSTRRCSPHDSQHLTGRREILKSKIMLITSKMPVAQSVQCLTTDWTAGVRSPTEAEDFSSNLCIQTGPGYHPASCTVGTGGSFPGGKARPGRDADHSPPSSAEVKKE